MALIILKQILVMSIYMLIGYLLFTDVISYQRLEYRHGFHSIRAGCDNKIRLRETSRNELSHKTIIIYSQYLDGG